MKKACFLFLCVSLVVLAPAALAADGRALSLDGLLSALIEVLAGLGDEPEMGPELEPFGRALETPLVLTSPGDRLPAVTESGPNIEPVG